MSDPRDTEGRNDDVVTSGETRGGSTPEVRGARVYDRPERGGRSTLSWVLIALVVILLALWLLF